MNIRLSNVILLTFCFICACDFQPAKRKGHDENERSASSASEAGGNNTHVAVSQDIQVQIAKAARDYLSNNQKREISTGSEAASLFAPADFTPQLPLASIDQKGESSPDSFHSPLVSKSIDGLRILFVGNSYLAYKPLLEGKKSAYSVATQLMSLIEQDNNNVDFAMHSIGGGSLKEHWEQGQGENTPRADIASGKYDLLVIQGRYDIHRTPASRKRFDDYIDLFLDLAASNDMKTLVYGLWSTDKWIDANTGDTFGPVAHDIYRAAAKRHGASYAPNGMAYADLHSYLLQSMDEISVENYTTDDKIHPSISMAYMIANVVYTAIFSEPAPLLSRYRPPGVDDAEGVMLRDIARRSVRQYGG